MDNFFDAYMQEHNRLASEFQTLHSQLRQTIRRFNEENRQALEALEKMKINHSTGSLFLINQNGADKTADQGQLANDAS